MFPTALLWAGILGTLLLVEPGVGRRRGGGRESSRGGREGWGESSRGGQGGGRESSRPSPRHSMWADQASLVSMMQSSLISIKPTIIDINLNDMMRPICFLGQVSESDLPGFYEPKKFVYRNTSEKSDVPNGNRAAPPASRASNAKTQTQVKPFPHKPKKDDPQGCGNPVCVIIDSKPRRFKSLCEFKSFLQTENRLSQVNFVQKGDCYDIIDNPKGAEKKTWSDNAKDCSMCQENDLCNGPIVVVVDLGSYLNGKSSAPGGGIHKENSEEGTKQSGIPFEFCSICEAMKFFENSENLNIETQLVGIGFGKTCNLFPLNGGSSCMWTEYFDYDTPCNSEEDVERHVDHFKLLSSSYTGPFRICAPEDVILTGFEGGSEITQIKAEQNVPVVGYGADGTPFPQHVVMSKGSISCRNGDQEIASLPPPFVYADDLNTTCLDYKSRYCCRTQSMWRPISVTTFQNRLPPTIPLGAAITTYKLNKETNIIEFSILIHDGKEEKGNLLVISFLGTADKGEFVGKIICLWTRYSTPLYGRFTMKELPNKSKEYTLTFVTPPAGQRTSGSSEKVLSTFTIYLHWDTSSTAAVATVITDEVGIVSTTQVLPQGYRMENIKKDPSISVPGNSKEKKDSPFILDSVDLNEDSPLSELLRSWETKELIYEAVLVDRKGGVQTIVLKSMKMDKIEVSFYTGSLNIQKIESKDGWEVLSHVFKTYSITTIVESPPLANLFHECEWKDWVNADFPGNTPGGEFELKDQIAMDKRKKSKLYDLVCGKKNPHYVDAVTVEDQVPWYELKMDKETYQTFKLTPLFGYICKDENGPSEFCKDMKVRYCCPKVLRAVWGEWGDYSQCDKSCGGGTKTRTRECFKDPKLDIENIRCEGDKKPEKYAMEQQPCNVNACPEDAQFGDWSAWTACSLSCGSGSKQRTRTCYPARGGGKECPEKLTNQDLYTKTELCTNRDCDTYSPTPWSQWSSCSASCGVGSKTRSRKCQNDKTFAVVSEENCIVASSDPRAAFYFADPQKCFLQDCPIDGMWSNWEGWNQCSQSCVTEPQKGEKIETKAYMRRYRYCNNPMPKSGGNECMRDEKNEYDRRQNAEVQKQPCMTPDYVGEKIRGMRTTPWCPEHCVYTNWGEWSPCSYTCITPKVEVIGYDGNFLAPDIFYHVTKSEGEMPKRSRMKLLLRPAKNGGTCKEDLDSDTSFNNGTVIEDHQDCTICKEHCGIGEKEVKSFPELKYPGKEPNCTGYCPVSCSMGPFRTLNNPLEKVKIYKEERKKMLESSKEKLLENESEACFTFALHKAAVKMGLTDVADKFVKYIETMKKKVAKGEIMPKEWNSLPNDIVKSSDDEQLLKTAMESFTSEISTFKSLIYEEKRRYPEEPVLDGLFGGYNCLNTANGRNLTSRKELQENEKKFTKIPYEDQINVGCDFPICDLKKPPNKPIKGKCIYFNWGEWGAWGKCSKSCGNEYEGKRERKRKCLNSCTNEESDAGKCPGKDSQDANCTPCPADKYGYWELWSSWKLEGEPACSKGKTDRKIIKYRTRECIADGEVKMCPPTIDGIKEGTDKEEKFMYIPDCQEGQEYTQYLSGYEEYEE